MLSKRNLITLSAALAIMLTAGGCKSKKQMVSSAEQPVKTEIKRGETETEVRESQSGVVSPVNQGYRTLKAKAVMTLPMLNMVSVKATVSVEVGKNIMISLQPLLGMEMYRIVCTNDYIIFIDKLTHQYMAEPYKNFTDKNYNLNYQMVEALLCNRYCDPLQEDYKDLLSSTDAGTTIYRKQAPNYYVEFLTQNNLIYRTTFASNDGSQYVMADYSAFTTTGGYQFPTAAVCNVQSKVFPLSFNISFSNVEFDGEVNITETFPSGYNKISLETLTQSFFSAK